MNLHDNKDISQAIRQGSKSYPNCLCSQDCYLNNGHATYQGNPHLTYENGKERFYSYHTFSPYYLLVLSKVSNFAR